MVTIPEDVPKVIIGEVFLVCQKLPDDKMCH